MKIILTILLCYISLSGYTQNTYQIAVLKYNGGGDWYANPTALPNLIAFCNENIGTNIRPEPATVEVGSKDIFNYPFLHMTGHGNVIFSQSEAENLRNYLLAGGFLMILQTQLWDNMMIFCVFRKIINNLICFQNIFFAKSIL